MSFAEGIVNRLVDCCPMELLDSMGAYYGRSLQQPSDVGGSNRC